MLPKHTTNRLDYFFHHFFAQKNGVLQRRRSKNFVHYNYTVRCSLVKDTVNPDQVILQFAAVVFNVLFSPKMRKEPVEKEEPSFLAGDGTTYGSQIMQLCEGTGKVVLPPWFGPVTTIMRSPSLKWKSLQTMDEPSPMSLWARARSYPS